jgi:hypothetical protein
VSKTLCLSHEYTPDTLAEVNLVLEGLLYEAEPDEAQLMILIGQREKLVNLLLNTMHQQQKRCFAQAELKINEQLVQLITAQRLKVKEELAGYAKASKAIKQYHQV